MEALVGCISILVSIIIFVIEVWLIQVSLNFRAKHCKKCKGFLHQQKYIKNKRVGLYSARYIKDYLEYVYVYRVDGHEYFIEGGTGGKKGDLPMVVEIVYQSQNPKRAYIKNLSSPFYPIVSIILLPFLILFLICGIMLVI